MNERASKDSGPYTSVYKPRSMPCGGFCGEIKGGILLALCRIKLGCPLVNAALGGPPRECSAELRTRIVLLRFYYPLFYPSTPRLYRPLYRPRLYRHLFPFLPLSLPFPSFFRTRRCLRVDHSHPCTYTYTYGGKPRVEFDSSDSNPILLLRAK